MTGTIARRSARANATAATSPATRSTAATSRLADGAAVNPATAIASKIARTTGSARLLSGGPDGLNASQASSITAAHSGTLTRKIHRQPRVAVINPPRSGATRAKTADTPAIL